MDIEEVRKKKTATEEAIRKLLVAFSADTGLAVEGVRFQMTDVTTIGGPRQVSCTWVSMDVRIS